MTNRRQPCTLPAAYGLVDPRDGAAATVVEIRPDHIFNLERIRVDVRKAWRPTANDLGVLSVIADFIEEQYQVVIPTGPGMSHFDARMLADDGAKFGDRRLAELRAGLSFREKAWVMPGYASTDHGSFGQKYRPICTRVTFLASADREVPFNPVNRWPPRPPELGIWTAQVFEQRYPPALVDQPASLVRLRDRVFEQRILDTQAVRLTFRANDSGEAPPDRDHPDRPYELAVIASGWRLGRTD